MYMKLRVYWANKVLIIFNKTKKGGSMRKIIAISVVVLMAVLAVAPAFAAIERTARIDDFYGDVLVKREASAKTIKAFKNMRLDEGDTIITGKDSKAVIKLDGDKEVILAANTVVVVSELANSASSTQTTFTLQSGGIGSKIDKKLDLNSKYRIKTPTAVMGVRGTEFYVQIRNGKADIWLAEGVIEVDYRMDGNKLAPMFVEGGELKTKILTAPSCLSIPVAGERFGAVPKEFKIQGLYYEFLEPEVLNPLGFDEDDIDEERTAAQIAEDKREAEAAEIPAANVSYDDVAYDDLDIDDDDPVPTANMVFVQHLLEYVSGSYQQVVYNQWCPYRIDTIHGTYVTVTYQGVTREVLYRDEVNPGDIINELPWQ